MTGATRVLSLWLKRQVLPEESKSTPLDSRLEIGALASELYRFSPLVAFSSFSGEETDGVYLDVSGCSRLFDGEVNLLREVSNTVRPTFPEHRIAIAPSPGAAWAFCRFSEKKFSVVSKTNLRAALGNLPLGALRLDDKTVRVLEELNLLRIEDILRIPRTSLLNRFGPKLLERIDQALGYLEEPLKPVSFQPEFRIEKVFAGPVLEEKTLRLTAEHLLRRMIRRLAADTKKPAHLLLEWKTALRPLLLKEITLSIPTDNEKHLLALLLPQIEKLDMGIGVEWLALRVQKTGLITATPAASPLGGKHFFAADQQTGELFDRLCEHLGPENICSLETHQSHIPERAFEFKRHCFAAPAMTGHAPGDRPSLLFHHPAPIDVIAALPDHPPVWLKWRGNRYRIAHAFGPERIAPEWWGKDFELGRTREYFKVQLTSGAWLWVFREIELQRWFLHGLWC